MTDLNTEKSCKVDPNQKEVTVQDIRKALGMPEEKNGIVTAGIDFAKSFQDAVHNVFNPAPKPEMAKAPSNPSPSNG